jgi:hypothetical protein
MIKNLFYLTIVAMIPAIAFVACSSETVILPMDIGLDKSSATLIPGESITLTVDILPGEAVPTYLFWSSSNTDVATVDNGVVKAIAEGLTTISVSIDTKLGQKKKFCQVTVTYPVKSVSIDKNNGFLSIGESLTLAAVVMPEDAPDTSITWSSSNPEVATVADGVVFAKGHGTTIISATTNVGNRIATCRVKVFKEKYMFMTFQYLKTTTFLMSGHGKVEIDWGDGSENKVYNLSPAVIDSIGHNYSNLSLNIITIEGERVEYLNCSGNMITSLDVKNNNALKDLDCSNNRLSILDISKNTALTSLNCSNNPFFNLDLSCNDKLTTLYCISNQLASLNLNNNVALKELNCSFNQLTDLDMSSNTELIDLKCINNELTGLRLNKSIALENLNCSNNQLESLDVSKNAMLTDFYCNSNQLTSLDISNNLQLSTLDCSDNTLKNIDTSKNILLSRLHCSQNQLTFLDMSENIALTRLNCQKNRITSLDFSNNTQLVFLQCQTNQLSYDALINLFETLHDKSIDLIKPLCIYDNPGTAGINYSIMDALNFRTRWFIYRTDMNGDMLNPWEFNW